MHEIEFPEQIADDMLIRIDEWAESEFNDGNRNHLGGSEIGDSCARKLAYSFRWFAKPFSSDPVKNTFSVGQKMRLFQRGHREEEVFVQYLTAIGCTFNFTKDTQSRVSDCMGHFGGSLDNIGRLPEKYGYPKDILFEFKTIGEKYFKELQKEGVKIAQDKHWAQICTYGFLKDLDYCLYCSVNKNTDELYFELVALDKDFGAIQVRKAESIIFSEKLPQKFSLSPTNFICKHCNFRDHCHYKKTATRNCRSCKFGKPAPDGEWFCTKFAQIIPEDFIPKGCDQHEEFE